MHSLNHRGVFKAAELVGLLFLGLATGGRAEIEAQRSIAHGRFNEQDRFRMKGSHHVAEGNLGADESAIRIG